MGFRLGGTTWFYTEDDRVLVAFDGKAFTPGEPRYRADDRQWLPRGDDFVGVSDEGAILLRKASGDIQTLHKPPKDFAEHRGAAVGWDPVRDVLVVAAGKANKKKVQETWESDLKTPLTRVKPKGRQPAEYDGLMTWHPGVGALVLVGGVLDHNDTPSQKTWLYDGTSWVSYPTDFKDKKDQPSSKLLAYDDRSGHLFLVRWALYRERCALWVWGGDGKWTAAGDIAPLPSTLEQRWGGVNVTVTFDAAARTLVAFGMLDDGSGGVGSREAAIGPWLDALPKPKLAAAKAPAAKSSAVAGRRAARR